MATPRILLVVPLGLLFACSLAAQRGHSGGGASHGGSRGGGGAPHASPPIAHPRPSAPMPSPQFSNPTPRHSNPAPTPMPRTAPNPMPRTAPAPQFGNPGRGTPNLGNPGRGANPAPTPVPRPSQPGVNFRSGGNAPAPAAGGTGGPVVTRPTLTPRVTTRGDVRPSPGGTRYQPTPTPRAPGGAAGQVGTPSVVRPTPHTTARTPVANAPGATTRPTTSVVPNRYQPTLRTPNSAAPTISPRTGGQLTPRSTATPAPTLSPRGATATGVPRLGGTASPGVPRTGGTRGVASAPRSVARFGAPAATNASGPHLMPRAAAPRLGFPRNVHGSGAGGTRISQPIATTYGAPRYTWGRSYCNTGHVWNSWWDPCGRWGPGFPNYSYGGFGYGYGPYGFYGGFGGLSYYRCGSFGFGISLWQPWWTWRNYYWNSCYSTAWWSTWSSPCYVSSGYWWYPTTTYMPTYLYVPNTVYVPTTVTAPATVVQASDSGSGGSVDVAPTIVAGGSVVGTARGAGLPADVTSDDMAVALAIKYVDLGDFYFRAGRFDDAVEAYGKARTYAPNDASVHFVLADAAFANGDYHYAAFLIAEAVRLDPAIVSATTDKRTLYGDAKQFDAQLAALEAYLAKQPYDAMAHLVRAYNLRFSGRTADAAQAFGRVLEIDPEHRAAKAFLAALPAGDL